MLLNIYTFLHTPGDKDPYRAREMIYHCIAALRRTNTIKKFGLQFYYYDYYVTEVVLFC